MIAKTITYVDYNGDEQTETFYFNLSKRELLQMQMSKHGGYDTFIKKIIAAEDFNTVFNELESMVKKSYGVKTPDGRFIKNNDLLAEFMSTEAYNDLIFELATNADEATKWVNGLIPSNLAEEVAKLESNKSAGNSEVTTQSNN